MGPLSLTLKIFFIRVLIHMISLVMSLMDLYSALVDERESVGFFLDFHQMMSPLSRMRLADTDLLASGHEAQSASAAPISESSLARHLDSLSPML